MPPYLNHRFLREKGKRKGHEKIFEEEIVKISLKWEKE